ncbi:glyoxylate reductase [Xylariomycetidae sp. FL2044]|nr:glyoxylate reductase [Xylariomycetidae sp. FL2044]
MEKPKVLLLGKIEHAHETWSQIQDLATILTPSSSSPPSPSPSPSPTPSTSTPTPSPTPTLRQSFIHDCLTGRFDDVLVAYRTFDSTSTITGGPLDAELVSHLPSSLRFICHAGAGYDSIDVAACRKRGIRVSNTPGVVDEATADLAVWLMLGALRNLNVGAASLRAGGWRCLPATPTTPTPTTRGDGDGDRDGDGDGGGGGNGVLPALGRDPRGKVLGILGMGGIGRCVARKAALAFGMRVRYHNRARLPVEVEAECGGAEYRGFRELLAESDVLSLNLPLNPQTHHLISTPEFATMKPGAVIINTARGAIMDEAALVAALDSSSSSSSSAAAHHHHLGGAGLDVYEHEPEVHPGLVANPRVLLLPHMGTWTVETMARMEECAMENVRAALLEGRLRSIVPEQRDMQ